MINYVDMFFAIAMILVGIGILVATWRIGKIPDETILRYARNHDSSIKNRLWVKILMMERKRRIANNGRN